MTNNIPGHFKFQVLHIISTTFILIFYYKIQCQKIFYYCFDNVSRNLMYHVCSPSVVSDSLGCHGLQPARQAPLCMEFSRQEYWSGVPFCSPGDLPDSEIKPLCLLHWQADSLPLVLTKKPCRGRSINLYLIRYIRSLVVSYQLASF